MRFTSILFLHTEDSQRASVQAEPDFFGDLNLDQIIEAVTAGRQDYDLKLFFYTSLKDIDAVLYRHEVFKDLENETLYTCINDFVQKMRLMREYLVVSDKLYYPLQKKRWFLDAIEVYCDAAASLRQDLSGITLKSRGFISFRSFLDGYCNSADYLSLKNETRQLTADLAAINYSLHIKENCIKVRKYKGEINYSEIVEAAFLKFKQHAAKDHLVKYSDIRDMNHIEAAILNKLARLFPDTFSALEEYCRKNQPYLDETLKTFDREIQFYIAFMEYMETFRRAGLKFCYPQVLDSAKDIYDHDGFDLALAGKLIAEDQLVVCNDFYLQDRERIIVVTGPNQGGKTTFARTFGLLHYLLGIGCPVPGTRARLYLCDRLFTHFEKEENIKNLHGKLQDDLVRIHTILKQASTDSIIIMNEIFTSTTLNDAVILSKQIMQEIMDMDLLCVCVTFLDELASLSDKTVSMVSTIVPENPSQRTYKIIRRPADGLSYAISIAEKYQLTYHHLKERIK